MNQSNRVNILGVGVSAIDIPCALQTFEEWIEKGEKHYVCVTGVHGVMESQGDPELRDIHNHAGLVTPDGMPLVWIGRLRGWQQMDRVYGPDLMLAFCERSVFKGYRHFLYGGAAGIPEQLADALQVRFPSLKVVGTYSPPFRPLTGEENNQVVTMINGLAPDVVWVGLSTPKQEHWMASHVGQIHASVMVGVGAAFDFLSGRKRQAPRWMQCSGLEWLFRLVQEPQRLGPRYLSNNPRFIIRILMQMTGLRKYKLEN